MLSLEATYAIAETCLCVHVQTARRVVARHADSLFRPLGLTSGQFAMLLTLHRAAPITVGDLAKRLTMNPSTATADLKPLERRGSGRKPVACNRRPCAARRPDRRRSHDAGRRDRALVGG